MGYGPLGCCARNITLATLATLATRKRFGGTYCIHLHGGRWRWLVPPK
jgi:hypothetical protein